MLGARVGDHEKLCNKDRVAVWENEDELIDIVKQVDFPP